MKAIVVDNSREGNPLEWKDVDDPQLNPDEVLIRVHATSLNRADLLQRAGHYPPPRGASPIMGLDVAGEIIAVGEEVAGWGVGDRVCALVPGGGYAELAAVPASMLLPIPGNLSFVEAGAIPEVFLTAYVNIFMEGAFSEGERVLIHGGASGVGSAAIQLVNLAGGVVYTTAGTAEKVAFCESLGAHCAIHYKEEDFVQRILEETGGEGVDIILDMVGAAYLERNISVLKTKGRLIFIATLGGAEAAINIRVLMGKRLRLIGSVLRARPPEEKSEITASFRQRFWHYFATRELKPVIDSVFPITQVEAAHARMAAYENIGKIVLQVA